MHDVSHLLSKPSRIHMFEDSQVDPEESASTFSSELNSGKNGKEKQN